MKRTFLLGIALTMLLLYSPSLHSQTARNSRVANIDTSKMASPDVVAAATTTSTGTFVFNFTITVKSTLPATDTIFCTASATVTDLGSGGFIDDAATVTVTRGSGATVACKVSIPYSWPLASAATDMVNLQIDVFSTHSTTNPANLASPARTHLRSLGNIKVPLSGATTTNNVAVTL